MRELIGDRIYDLLVSSCDISKISELRLRVGAPFRYIANGLTYTLYGDNREYIVDKCDIDYILAIATGRSMYAYNEQIARGYIVYKGGVRIGIAGQGVEVSGKISLIKFITSIVIRIPCECKGVAEKVIAKIGGPCKNVLIIAPPGVGKTTFLRDYVRIVSNMGNNVVLIDERCELSGMMNGEKILDVGSNTDVLTGIGKIRAYELAVRCLSPDIIATDEIFGKNEIDAIEDIVRAGVSVVATIHAKSLELLQNTEYFRIIQHFYACITLDLGYADRIKSCEILSCQS